MSQTGSPFTERTKLLVAKSAENYLRHARIKFSVDTVNRTIAWCTAHQVEPAVNGEVFTAEEILSRAQEAFTPLQADGIEPIICVYTIADGDALKSRKKHRKPPVSQIRGVKTAVLRIAQPRALFTSDPTGELFLLEIEDLGAAHLFDQLRAKAKAWLKREGWR